MPFRNESCFLYKTIDSIRQQSYSNWELIAVDDNSTDDSLSIVREYAKSDDRIKVFKNEGVGIIPALQTGYSKIRGRFVTRMDADDLMLPYKLEQLRNTIIAFENPKCVAVGKVRYFKSDGSEIGNGFSAYEKWLNSITEQGENFKEIYKECPIPSPSWMMRKDTFDAIGAFDGELYPEDYELAFRMYKNKITPIATPDVVHLWRDYPERTSRTHIHYLDNSFFKLKVSQFLSIDYAYDRELILVGAGKKGKKVAKELLNSNVSFSWLSNNSKKIGHFIYGMKIKDSESFDCTHAQVIVAVSSPSELEQIKKSEISSTIYYYFC